jgi:phosphinothricin acetyltransferase
MTEAYGREVMDIINYYIENTFAAYPESRLPYEFYERFLGMTFGYPAYVIKDKDSREVMGFCMLRAYNPFPVFKESAEISYFLKKDVVGRGIGKLALDKLVEEARGMGIKTLLASISSQNAPSLRFHEKHGFRQCGLFSQVGKKKGIYFDVIWMQKDI